MKTSLNETCVEFYAVLSKEGSLLSLFGDFEKAYTEFSDNPEAVSVGIVSAVPTDYEETMHKEQGP